jgi:hypothetical protein
MKTGELGRQSKMLVGLHSVPDPCCTLAMDGGVMHQCSIRISSQVVMAATLSNPSAGGE